MIPLELELIAGSVGGPGNLDGVGTSARFAGPEGVALDAAGNLYVAERDNDAIRKIAPNGAVTTLPHPVPDLSQPADVEIDSSGNLYVLEWSGQVIRKITGRG